MVAARLKILLTFLLLFGDLCFSQMLNGTSFNRVSRAGNFEFRIYNDGKLFFDPVTYLESPIAQWPRGSFHLTCGNAAIGPIVLAKKNDKYFTSYSHYNPWYALPQKSVFSRTVPGRIGDPRAPSDSTFNGAGWRYVDDPDYIIYSGMDYDSNGTDISGNNYNDWPVRLVNGHSSYVTSPHERKNYTPVFRSDEDLFLVFKDTDTRSNKIYSGPAGPGLPAGLEYQMHIYSWKTGLLKNIVLFSYDIINKSGGTFDSCFISFGTGMAIQSAPGPGVSSVPGKKVLYKDASRTLCYFNPSPENLIGNPASWTSAAPIPVIGFPLLQGPKDYSGKTLDVSNFISNDTLKGEYDGVNGPDLFIKVQSDSILYRQMTTPSQWKRLTPRVGSWPPLGYDGSTPNILCGPFPLQPDDTAHYVLGYMFAEDTAQLHAMHKLILQMYQHDLQRPVPPPPSRLTASGINKAILLRWGNEAESATDIIIPDNLGKPFKGYRLLRAQKKTGPYVEIGRWTTDSLLVHEFLDDGKDLGGLKNNIRYYYRLLSFDEGAPSLKLDPMESAIIEGFNAVSAVPSTEPVNVTGIPGDGSLSSGSLGAVSGITLIPADASAYSKLFSGKQLRLTMNTVSDGKKYTIPVTVKDSLSGREHSAIVDPLLNVHGSSQSARVIKATARIENLFNLGGADLQFDYSFEQLADSFWVRPAIQSTAGADVPVIVKDSLRFTGVSSIDPFKTKKRELTVEFISSGIDTVNAFFKRYIPYLEVRLIENGIPVSDSIPWNTFGIRDGASSGNTITRTLPRYYLSGTLSNGEKWDFGLWFNYYNSVIAFDYGDHGRGCGKASPYFSWGSCHRQGTKDFSVGDKVTLTWSGGVIADFPNNARVVITGGAAERTAVTNEMMEKIRIVPNPYIAHHQGQTGTPVIYFNYLPDQCTIRIYTLALDPVKTIEHASGSREEWNLQTGGGQLVASQMFYAYIDTPNGSKTIKKFSVIIGK